MSKKTNGPSGTDADSGALVRGEPSPARRAVEDDDAFIDLWLRLELQESFNAVVEEPIPEDLLRLIEEDRGERERIRRSRGRGA